MAYLIISLISDLFFYFILIKLELCTDLVFLLCVGLAVPLWRKPSCGKTATKEHSINSQVEIICPPPPPSEEDWVDQLHPCKQNSVYKSLFWITNLQTVATSEPKCSKLMRWTQENQISSGALIWARPEWTPLRYFIIITNKVGFHSPSVSHKINPHSC